MWKAVRLDSEQVWNDAEVRTRLSRYFGMLNGVFLPKFKIAKLVPAKFSLDSSEDELWREHRRASKDFAELKDRLDRCHSDLPKKMTPGSASYLDLKIALAKTILQNCHFCERRCNVNRLKNEKGFCKLGKDSLVSTYFLHLGEESVLVPSGTIFFTSCNFGPCVFCQNADISSDPDNGSIVTPIRLSKIVASLKQEGARNVNWVGGSPTPNLHNILESMKYTKDDICQLWNSNFYMSNESTELLLDVIDFWLPDMKWFNDECALRYSQVPNYWSVVSRNHKATYYNGGGEMIVRHLLMPGHLRCCTKPILEWISKTIPKALVNVMGQYRPCYLASNSGDYSDINRRLSSEEIEEARMYADDLGLLWRPVS
jgi:putative pyruvate formate lyase activating enzyme